MPRCEIADTAVLGATLRGAWNALRGSDPVYASPYFSPEFHEAVASVTRSARLLIVEDAGSAVAMLPFQHRPAGLCGPIGGHLNDMHGLIAHSSFDMPADVVLERAGLPMVSLRHAPIGTPALGARFGGTHGFRTLVSDSAGTGRAAADAVPAAGLAGK